jgi:hypothetical protein
MPFKKIGKKIFSGKGYSGKKGKVEMLEVKPADRSTSGKRAVGKYLVSQSKTKNLLRQINKEHDDYMKELDNLEDSNNRMIERLEGKGERGPSKKFDDIEKTVTDLETGEVEKYAKGGLVKKGIARGCGKIMSNRRKVTKYF